MITQAQLRIIGKPYNKIALYFDKYIEKVNRLLAKLK